jgi:hypothetical protein
MKIPGLVIAGTVALTGLCLFLVARPSAASPTITWSPQSLAPEVIAGSSTTTTISFSSSEKLTEASVLVSREFGGIITVTPTFIGTIPPGKVVSLTLTASPAVTSMPSSLQGSIALYRKSPIKDIPYGLPLSVNMKVIWPSITNPDHSYTVNYPPLLTAHFDVSYGDLLLLPPPEAGDTEAPGIVVSKEANPDNLSIRDFFDGTHAPDLFSQSLDIFSTSTLSSGATAYFFDPITTLAGGVVVVVQRSQAFLVVQDHGGGYRSDIDVILNSLSF